MNIIEERKKLVDKINKISNPNIIDEINNLLNNELENSLLTMSQINLVRKRQEEYLKEPNQLITLNNFKESIKKKYGF